jgi:hypothetical protein
LRANTVGVRRSLRITAFGTYKGASAIMRKAFDKKRAKICYVGSGSRAPELYFVSPDTNSTVAYSNRWCVFCAVRPKATSQGAKEQPKILLNYVSVTPPSKR